jgi:hypothetical protein
MMRGILGHADDGLIDEKEKCSSADRSPLK